MGKEVVESQYRGKPSYKIVSGNKNNYINKTQQYFGRRKYEEVFEKLNRKDQDMEYNC